MSPQLTAEQLEERAGPWLFPAWLLWLLPNVRSLTFDEALREFYRK